MINMIFIHTLNVDIAILVNQILFPIIIVGIAC